MILGPPGTGKTTRLLELVRGDLKSHALDQIAFVSFSKAACEESLSRLQRLIGRRINVPYFRTLHSVGYMLAKDAGLIPSSKKVMMAKDLRAFAKAGNWRLSGDIDEDDLESSATNEHDALRLALDWSRNRCRPLEEGLKSMNEALGRNFTMATFNDFVASYERWKRREQMIDFMDMIEQGIASGLRLDVPIVYIDEAQDLSPLQQTAVEQWFSGVDKMVIAGDDDQCIYEFQGCDHHWMVEMSKKADSVTILDQSYRIPATTHSYASEIIHRNADTRLEKVYRPRPESGVIHRCSKETLMESIRNNAPDAKSFFYLARTNKLAASFAAVLAENQLSWTGFSPRILDPRKVFLGRAAVDILLERHPRRNSFEKELLDSLLAYASKPQLPFGDEREALWRASQRPGDYEPEELRRLLPVFTAALRRNPWAFLGSFFVDPVMPNALSRAEAKAGYSWLLDEPEWTLGTFHASKGREADVVVVDSTWSGRAVKEMQRSPLSRAAENRLAYVGVTRTKQALFIVDTEDAKFTYDFPEVVSTLRKVEETE